MPIEEKGLTDEPEQHDDDQNVRERAYEISQRPGAGSPDENWRRAERELAVVHEYDTADRDLERTPAVCAAWERDYDQLPVESLSTVASLGMIRTVRKGCE